MHLRLRRGFTLLELLVATTVIAIFCSLALPSILNVARENSRKQACSDNIGRIGLALMQYEQAYKQLVSLNCTWGYGGYSGIPYWSTTPGYEGAGRWSGLIALLPFLDAAPLQSAFDKGTSGQLGSLQKSWGPYGSVLGSGTAVRFGAPADSLRYPWSSQYQPNRQQVSTFRCPSDPSKMRTSSMWNVARTNYAFCLGDGQVGINGGDPVETQTRGAFQCNQNFTMAMITDGASKVIAFGEIATPNSSLFNTQGKGITETDAPVQGRALYELAQQSDSKGIDVRSCRALIKAGRYTGAKRNWGNIGVRNFDALANYTGFNTINAPNGGSCTPTDNAWGEGEGIYTASSYHFGGAHTITFDETVRFINDGVSTIDNRVGKTDDDYYSPGRQWKNNDWYQTPNWEGESPFGVWGAMGTRTGNDASCHRPLDSSVEYVRSLAYISTK